MELREKLTTQNVIIGLLSLAVLYLMYVNYTRNCDEKYSTVPTGFVGGSPDPINLPFVLADAQGNLMRSDNLKTGGNSGINIGAINATSTPVPLSSQQGAILLEDVLVPPTLSLNKSYIYSDRNSATGGLNELVIAGHNRGITGAPRMIGLLGNTDINGSLSITGGLNVNSTRSGNIIRRPFNQNNTVSATSTPPPGVAPSGTQIPATWIVVDDLFKIKYSFGVASVEWANVVIIPTNTVTTRFYSTTTYSYTTSTGTTYATTTRSPPNTTISTWSNTNITGYSPEQNNKVTIGDRQIINLSILDFSSTTKPIINYTITAIVGGSTFSFGTSNTTTFVTFNIERTTTPFETLTIT